jgi:hypothetical protein
MGKMARFARRGMGKTMKAGMARKPRGALSGVAVLGRKTGGTATPATARQQDAGPLATYDGGAPKPPAVTGQNQKGATTMMASPNPLKKIDNSIPTADPLPAGSRNPMKPFPDSMTQTFGTNKSKESEVEKTKDDE